MAIAFGNAEFYNPLSIEWSNAWWASDPTWTPPANAAAVTTWTPAAGAVNLTQATSTKRPLFYTSVAALNNKPGISFDGTDDVLAGVVTTVASFSVVVVATSTEGLLVSLNSSDTSWFGLLNAAPSESVRYYFGGTDVYMARMDSMVPVGVYTYVVRSGVSSTAGFDNFFDTQSSPNTATINTVTVGGLSTTSAFCSTSSFGFVGVYTGDVTAHAKWAGFLAWARSFYGTEYHTYQTGTTA